MKGFKDSDGKFRPISNSKGTSRKKKSKTTKPSGTRIRTVTLKPESIKKVNNQIKKDLDADKPTNFSVALNEVVGKSRLKRDEITTIADLDGRDDFDLVQVDTDIEETLDFLGQPKGAYDGLFVKQKDGDIIEAYGFFGNVPFLNKSVDRIETPAEMLEKKFGRKKRDKERPKGFLFVKDFEKNKKANEELIRQEFDAKVIQVWDSGAKFADRYTVVVADDIFGIGENFNQFAGNVSQRDINTGNLVFTEKNFGKKLDFIPDIVVERIMSRYIDEQTGVVQII